MHLDEGQVCVYCLNRLNRAVFFFSMSVSSVLILILHSLVNLNLIYIWSEILYVYNAFADNQTHEDHNNVTLEYLQIN